MDFRDRTPGTGAGVQIALEPVEQSLVRQTADLKRIFDLWMLDSDFRNAYLEDPVAALDSTGLSVDHRAAAFMLKGERAADGQSAPESFLAFKGLMDQRLSRNDRLTRIVSVPKDPAFKDWRELQIRRCLRELGAKARFIQHVPIAYELSLGCSVGCPFCGASAGPLKKIFRYTDENAILWRDVLAKLHSILGEAAGTGSCYYANEPLDDPDYEAFLNDYYNEFSVIPQTTTAVAARDIERTRALLSRGQELYLHFDRLSIVSKEDMRSIMDSFDPAELLYTDLLPQFAGAPGCCMKQAGRNAKGKGEKGTIACVSGFIVNMAERSVRLETPVMADADHPTGTLMLEKKAFSSADDLEKAVFQMMERHMARTIHLSDFFSIR